MRVTKEKGLILEGAEVHRKAHIGPFVTVTGFAEVHEAAHITGSEIRPSLVKGNPIIFSGNISNSIIDGTVKIAGSVWISDSIVAGHKVCDHAQVLESGVFHFASVSENAQLFQVMVEDEARVYGSAILNGSKGTFTVGGRARIDRGTWHYAPRTLALDDEDFLTESVGGVLANCRWRDYATWLKIGQRIGEFRRWPQEKIDLALSTIREWSVHR